MNSLEQELVDNLRKKGYAVVIFSPDDLEGADPDHTEDRLVELGWDVIDSIRPDRETDEE